MQIVIGNCDTRTFTKRLEPVYKSINRVKKDEVLQNKDLIGFVGGPWTTLVYMLNKSSPKKLQKIFSDKELIKDMLSLINKYLSLFIKTKLKVGLT